LFIDLDSWVGGTQEVNGDISGHSNFYLDGGLHIAANTQYTDGAYSFVTDTMGRARLAAGTVQVYTEAVTLDSNIFLTNQDISGGAPGFLYVSARNISPSGSFTITSSSGTDTSIVAWLIVEPIYE
jgi:hypothetical protein